MTRERGRGGNQNHSIDLKTLNILCVHVVYAGASFPRNYRKMLESRHPFQEAIAAWNLAKRCVEVREKTFFSLCVRGHTSCLEHKLSRRRENIIAVIFLPFFVDEDAVESSGADRFGGRDNMVFRPKRDGEISAIDYFRHTSLHIAFLVDHCVMADGSTASAKSTLEVRFSKPTFLGSPYKHLFARCNLFGCARRLARVFFGSSRTQLLFAMCVCVKNIKRALARSQQLCNRLKSSPLADNVFEDHMDSLLLRDSIAEEPPTVLPSPETPNQTATPIASIHRENEEDILHITTGAVSHEQLSGN